MTAHRTVFISCDGTENLGAPCENSVDLDRVSQNRTAAQAREAARKEGWHTAPGGKDFCPECWAEGQR